jgi:uncharacterized protein (TIGR02117 family)
MNLLKYLIFSIIVFISFLLALEWICSRIYLNKDKQQMEGVEIFLLSNGTHTDLVMPVNNEYFNFETIFSRSNSCVIDSNRIREYIGVGWGDKGFYLETPTWADLKMKTALKAVSGCSESAIHATFMFKPLEDTKCVKIYVSAEQYLKLIAFIKNSLAYQNNQPIWIQTDAVYGNYDAFYEATGSYHLFKTCNTWTNQALKAADMKAAVWLAFEKPLINMYKSN